MADYQKIKNFTKGGTQQNFAKLKNRKIIERLFYTQKLIKEESVIKKLCKYNIYNIILIFI